MRRSLPLRGAATAALLGVALICAGCGSDALNSFTFMQSREKPVEPNILPTDFKTQILRTMPQINDDPTNLRSAFYSDPVIDQKSSINVYTSCVRFDPRDSSKQYLGSRDYIAYYYGGRLQQFVPATPGQCSYATFKPFPELEQACRKERCLNAG